MQFKRAWLIKYIQLQHRYLRGQTVESGYHVKGILATQQEHELNEINEGRPEGLLHDLDGINVDYLRQSRRPEKLCVRATRLPRHL